MSKGNKAVATRYDDEEHAKMDLIIKLNPSLFANKSEFVRYCTAPYLKATELPKGENPHHVGEQNQ